MPRRYKQGADGQPHPAFYGKLPEEFSKADTMRFMVETDLKLSGCVSADTLAALRAEGYDYKDGKRDYEKLWGEVSKVLRELSELVAK